MVPTFGVSFGLPYPSNAYGGYPLNPLGNGAPAQNPYFGSLSPNGLNLGLVNVNPLVSFQIAKNEFGEKLFKPLVNLHVTPNANIIQKVGDILKKKKFGFGGGPSVNQHYHTHTHYPNPPEIYYPHQNGGHIHYESHNHEGHGYPSAPGGYPSGFGGPSGYPPNSGDYSSGPSGYGGQGGYPGGPGGFPSGPAGGGYGFSGPPHGYYRDGSSNNPEDNYSYPQSQYNDNPNNYNAGRNFDNVTVNQGFIPYNYQDVYPQNQKLQSNGPPNAYADYQSYNQNNDRQQQAGNANPNTYPNQAPSNGQQNAQSVSFPNSRRKRSTNPDESISEDDTIASSLSDRENSSFKVEKVRSSQQTSRIIAVKIILTDTTIAGQIPTRERLHVSFN